MSEDAKRKLTWMGPESSPGFYLLRAENQQIGSLEFEDEEGRRARGSVAGRAWTLERTGILHPHVTVRSVDSGETVAELALRFIGSGVVSFASGERYAWRPANLLTTKWCLRREGDERVICFVQEGGLSAAGAKVIPCVDCSSLPEFPVLVLLGWYLRVLQVRRYTGAAVSCGQ